MNKQWFLVSGPNAISLVSPRYSSRYLNAIPERAGSTAELCQYKKIRILTKMKRPLCNCLSLNL